MHQAIEEHSGSLQKNLQVQKALAQEELSREEQKEKQECHQLFRLTSSEKDSTYEWYKDRVENRVEDTCMWLLNHDHFKKWLDQDSGPLLVTADPGCGKSVLAKYLIDDILPQSTSTVCYFFFKDQDQNTMRQALCALLHQLFSERPPLIKHAMKEYRSDGQGLINNTRSLWDIFHNAINDLRNSESIVIVLDALDECAESEFKDLVLNIKGQFNGNQMGYSGLKYLLTCRPYEQIVSNFRSLLSTFPYIRIPGEEESDAISREVDLVITHQVTLLAADKQLSVQIKNELQTRLQQVTNRTYLWIYLIFDYLKNESFKQTPKAITAIIMTLPGTINEAYNQILSKSKNDFITRKALNIVLAASRPLTVAEMNVAVNIDFESTHDLDLEDDKAFETRLRSCCGLFISIYHGRIYFLHQTAREFLIDTALSTATSRTLHWHHSITMRSSHAVLAEICVLFLSLFNEDTDLSSDAKMHRDNLAFYHESFLYYSAKLWNMHFHKANIVDADDAIIPFAVRICEPLSNSYSAWFSIYMQTKTLRHQQPGMITDLMVAAYFGHTVLITLLLAQGADIEAKDIVYGRTPIIWASLNGHEAVVKLLLHRGADFEVKDKDYDSTALLCAVAQGHETVVRTLLKNGADLEARDKTGSAPLLVATQFGREAIIKLLLKNGADIEARDKTGSTPLSAATQFGRAAIIKLLLKNGADIEARDKTSSTPLSVATQFGHETIVKLLLENGADIEARDKTGSTPLLAATENRHETIVKLLIENGADIEVKNRFNKTPLIVAVSKGEVAIIILLLKKGADIEEKDALNQTPLIIAAYKGWGVIVELLLKNGADIEAKNQLKRTPLGVAAYKGQKAIVELLLKKGADIEAKDELNRTPLGLAVYNRQEAVVKLLLEKGADIKAKDQFHQTLLIVAAFGGGEAIVKLLLEKGADV